MKFTLVAPETDRLVDREYNAGLGAGFSIGKSWRAKLLERLRGGLGEPSFVPFGYLSAILREQGHQVLRATHPPADGVMVIAPSLANFQGDLAAIQQGAATPGVTVVVIGNLASVRPELFAPHADLVIKGEPESVFLDLASRSLPTGVVQAIALRDLDSLPFPDQAGMRRSLGFFSFAFPEPTWAFVQASRSCPYSCGYCPYITTSAYRQRSVENVVAELKHLRQTKGIEGVVFRDPTFTLNRKWVVAFCEAIEREGLQLRWECETRLDRLDIELLGLMRRAGLRSLKVGVESADEQVLRDVSRKPISLLHQESMVAECRRLGVAVAAFYVLGLPTDTERSIRATVAYARQLNTDVARFHIFTPLPGTALFEEVKDRIIEEDWSRFDMFHVVFRHDLLSAADLYRLKEWAYLSYFFRWSYVWRRWRQLFAIVWRPGPACHPSARSAREGLV